MVCSPEQSRANGKLSKGPSSEKGKAIASRNATKHGILSQTPPLLATEDLESFQGMMQGLIYEYEPQTPIEHLLIQQIAMGWLRLHRLWGIEAATANMAILQAKRDRLNVYHPKKSDIPSIVREHKEKNLNLEIKREKHHIHAIIGKLTSVMSQKPNNDDDITWWLHQAQDALYYSDDCIRPKHAPKVEYQKDFWTQRDDIFDAIDNRYEDIGSNPHTWIKILLPCLISLGESAQDRLSELQVLEQQISDYDQAITDAKIASKGLQDSNLFSRYERHITKQIEQACDRLQSIQLKQETRKSLA